MIRIVQVPFNGEILAEAMQNNVLHLRCFAETAEPFTPGKWHRSATGKNLGRVIDKNLVDYAGGQRGPVYQCTAFNQQAGDFQFAQAGNDSGQVGPPVTGAEIG